MYSIQLISYYLLAFQGIWKYKYYVSRQSGYIKNKDQPWIKGKNFTITIDIINAL